jgi:hypothetical protein
MRRAAGALAVLLALAWGIARGEPLPETAAPELPETLPFDPQVADPVFSVLVALVRADLHGTLTREHLVRELERRRVRSRLPYAAVREVVRLPGTAGAQALVTIRFESSLDVPIPYRILWYHPGRIRGGGICAFREWSLGNVGVPYRARPETAAATLALSDVHVFELETGRLQVDIDGWLDRLMGSALDDTDLVGLAVFDLAGRGYGMALGHNSGQRPRSGAFDFREDRVVFPMSGELKAVARSLRARLESLEREPPAGAPQGVPGAPSASDIMSSCPSAAR